MVACAGEPERPLERPAAEVDSLTRAAPEEIRYELENLGYELGDLEALVESGAVPAVEETDPRATLADARSAYESALDAVAAEEIGRAADSLEVAADRVVKVKRALGLAEEGLEPFDAESIPVSVPESLTP